MPAPLIPPRRTESALDLERAIEASLEENCPALLMFTKKWSE